MKDYIDMHLSSNIIKKTKAHIYVCFCFFVISEIYEVKNEEQNTVLVKLGLTIRKIREESTNFSQYKLALEVGLSENQIQRIEKGLTNPTVKTLLKIAKALKVDIIELFR